MGRLIAKGRGLKRRYNNPHAHLGPAKPGGFCFGVYAKMILHLVSWF